LIGIEIFVSARRPSRPCSWPRQHCSPGGSIGGGAYRALACAAMDNAASVLLRIGDVPSSIEAKLLV
jgi:hypothetical protein